MVWRTSLWSTLFGFIVSLALIVFASIIGGVFEFICLMFFTPILLYTGYFLFKFWKYKTTVIEEEGFYDWKNNIKIERRKKLKKIYKQNG